MSTSTDSMLTLTVTCEDCGFWVKQGGDDAVRMMAQIDAAHDAMRPDCPQTLARGR